jgi:hypothetical protein
VIEHPKRPKCVQPFKLVAGSNLAIHRPVQAAGERGMRHLATAISWDTRIDVTGERPTVTGG